MNRVTKNKNKLVFMLPSLSPVDPTSWEESKLIPGIPSVTQGCANPFLLRHWAGFGGDYFQARSVWIAVVGSSSPWMSIWYI